MASCVPYLPEAQGSLLRGATHTVRTPYARYQPRVCRTYIPRTAWHHRCRVVDYIAVEWHPHFAPYHMHPKQHRNLSKRAEAITEARKATSLLKAAVIDSGRATGCRTKMVEMDDETYLHDGVLFPVPF